LLVCCFVFFYCTVNIWTFSHFIHFKNSQRWRWLLEFYQSLTYPSALFSL
jgi:hypothetical protein